MATDTNLEKQQPPQIDLRKKTLERTKGQRVTDIIIERIREEMHRDFPYLKSRGEEIEFRLVNKDGKYQLWLIVFTKDRDPESNDRLMKSAIWDGEEIDTFDYFNHGIREYLVLAQARKTKSFFANITSPTTIGAVIGILLVFITAIELFRASASATDAVPPQLWTLLTAVIAFYFGRGTRSGGVGATENDGA